MWQAGIVLDISQTGYPGAMSFRKARYRVWGKIHYRLPLSKQPDFRVIFNDDLPHKIAVLSGKSLCFQGFSLHEAKEKDPEGLLLQGLISIGLTITVFTSERIMAVTQGQLMSPRTVRFQIRYKIFYPPPHLKQPDFQGIFKRRFYDEILISSAESPCFSRFFALWTEKDPKPKWFEV